MKKKAIEKIPYKKIVGIPSGYKYFASAFVKIIDGEKNLIIDVYEKKDRKIPVVRNCYTKKDYSAYWPQKDIWTQMQICDLYSRNRWQELTGNAGKTYISEQDEQKINNFTKHISMYSRATWVDRLRRHEQDIQFKREQKRHENKKKLLEERSARVPELPQEFRDWIQTEVLGESFIYYKRKGRYAKFFCSHCGNEYTFATEQKDTYEGAFERIVRVPVHNERGRCHVCDTKAVFKAEGKTNGVWAKHQKAFIGQSIGDGAAVIRYYIVDKLFTKDLKENFIYNEVARAYYFPSKPVMIDYHKYDGYLGKSYWDYKNLGGMSNIKIEGGAIFEGTWQQLSDTCLQYSGAKEYMFNYDIKNLIQYMTAYHNYPYLEMISKLGMYKLADSIIERPWEVGIIKNAKNPLHMFGIDKEQLNVLIREHGDPECLRALQIEHELNQHWTDEQRSSIQALRPDKQKIMRTLTYMSVQKFINAVEKYAGASFETDRLEEWRKVKDKAYEYLDYLEMRNKRGYDMSNTVYLFPRDLEAAHAKMVLELEQKKLDERIQYVESEFENIRKHYRRNYKRFHFEDAEYIIRPARSAEEIVKEGRILHHCVGGDTYLRKHDTEESFILMLRFKKKQDIPYITVEIRDKSIVQWYGAHDKKPDEANMQKWLDTYITRLKCQSDGVNISNEALITA